MIGHYTLDEDGDPVPCEDLLEWGRWFQDADRTLASDVVHGDTLVSTVFLGLDHNYSGRGEPILWETMVFGGPRDGFQQRYSSKEEALTSHYAIVELERRLPVPLTS